MMTLQRHGHARWIGLIVLTLLPFAWVQAQDGLETFTFEGSGAAIQYPADWEVEFDPFDNSPYFLGDAVGMNVLDATILEATYGVAPGTDLLAILRLTSTFLPYFENNLFDADHAVPVTIGGRDALRYDYSDKDAGQEGIFVALQMSDETVGFVWAFTELQQLNSNEKLIFDMIATYDVGRSTTLAVDVSTLTNFDANWRDAIEELRSVGLIGEGGGLVFEEDRAFFEGRGEFFTPLARNRPFSDIVMAGEISFTQSGSEDTEICSMLARIDTDNRGTAIRFLEIGVASFGAAFYNDIFDLGPDDSTIGIIDSDIDLSRPHHFLMIVLDDRLTVYVDGELAIEEAHISQRTGTYGIGLRGSGVGARCEGRNIWVYEAPSFQPGVCEVSAPGTVNMRSGPGTNFDRAGQLNPGTIRLAQGQTIGEDGFVWWQLDDAVWVRDDVVTAEGDCRTVPDA